MAADQQAPSSLSNFPTYAVPFFSGTCVLPWRKYSKPMVRSKLTQACLRQLLFWSDPTGRL